MKTSDIISLISLIIAAISLLFSLWVKYSNKFSIKTNIDSVIRNIKDVRIFNNSDALLGEANYSDELILISLEIINSGSLPTTYFDLSIKSKSTNHNKNLICNFSEFSSISKNQQMKARTDEDNYDHIFYPPSYYGKINRYEYSCYGIICNYFDDLELSFKVPYIPIRYRILQFFKINTNKVVFLTFKEKINIISNKKD